MVKTKQNKADKSPALILTTFGVWGAVIGVLAPPLWEVAGSADNAWQFLVLVVFIGFLSLFWLLSAYYVALTLLHLLRNHFDQRRSRGPVRVFLGRPSVAILYPTCNDFRADAVMTCLHQDYRNYHVYILDDSDQSRFREQVDEFASRYPGRITVERRKHRRGFKAGNLNDALRGVASGCVYFAVMDADELLPTHFLTEAVAELKSEKWAFVQARHVPYSSDNGVFSRVLGESILPFWTLLLRLKNRWGFVPCVGHGVVFRYSAWHMVGGFPEVVSEDLAISARLLSVGKRGRYLEDLVCEEEFPASFTHYRKQQERYVTGVAQVLPAYGFRLLRSKAATTVEKVDFVLSCMPLFIPVFCLCFIFLAGILIPLTFGKPSALIVNIGSKTFSIPYYLSVDGRFSPVWSTSFVLLSVLCSLSPVLPMLMLSLQRQIKHPLRLVFLSLIAQMSTMLSSSWAGLQCLLSGGRMEFIPTGSKSISAAHGWQKVAEIGIACVIAVVLLGTLNVGLAAMALCPILAVALPIHSASFRIGVFLVVVGVVCNFIFVWATPLSTGGYLPFPFTIHF